jgi:hypothetical protein
MIAATTAFPGVAEIGDAAPVNNGGAVLVAAWVLVCKLMLGDVPNGGGTTAVAEVADVVGVALAVSVTLWLTLAGGGIATGVVSLVQETETVTVVVILIGGEGAGVVDVVQGCVSVAVSVSVEGPVTDVGGIVELEVSAGGGGGGDRLVLVIQGLVAVTVVPRIVEFQSRAK